MKGKTVLVTGASRGLGRAVALQFAASGAEVIGVARDANALAEVVAAANETAGVIRPTILDCCDEAAVVRVLAALPQLDIVVNNAGIARIRPLLETPTDELREILEINVVAAFVVMREAARHMAARGGGHIINIASDAALRGIPTMAPYCASKHALLGLGRALNLELQAQKVRVTSFCPGPIATDILGPGTASEAALPPHELAEMIVHIAQTSPRVNVQEILVTPSP